MRTKPLEVFLRKTKDGSVDGLDKNDLRQKIQMLYEPDGKITLAGTFRGIGSGKSLTCQFIRENLDKDIWPLSVSFGYSTPIGSLELRHWQDFVAGNATVPYVAIGLTIATRICYDVFECETTDVRICFQNMLPKLDMKSVDVLTFVPDLISELVAIRAGTEETSSETQRKQKVLLIVDEAVALEDEGLRCNPVPDAMGMIRCALEQQRNYSNYQIALFLSALRLSPFGATKPSFQLFLPIHVGVPSVTYITKQWYKLRLKDGPRKELIVRLLRVLRTLPRLMQFAEAPIKKHLVRRHDNKDLYPHYMRKTLKDIVEIFLRIYNVDAEITPEILTCMLKGWDMESDKHVMNLIENSMLTNIPKISTLKSGELPAKVDSFCTGDQHLHFGTLSGTCHRNHE